MKMLTYYPNNTFTERIFDENGLLSITHKRMEPATPANPNGTETVLESFTYAYNNATGNITRITTANGEYTDYTYDLLGSLIPYFQNFYYTDGIAFLKLVQDWLPCFAGFAITICCDYYGKLV